MRFASSKTLFLLASAIAALAWSAHGSHARTVPQVVREQIGFQLGMTRGRKAISGIDCFTRTTGRPATTCTPAQASRLAKQLAARQATLRPPSLASLNLVTTAPIGHDGEASLVAWRTTSGRLCLYIVRAGHGGNGPFGPCESACAGLCLGSGGSGTSLQSLTYVLGGAVDSSATDLRVTTPTGGSETYPLHGPVLAGTRLRSLLVDLGPSDWARVELLRGGTVLATRRRRVHSP